MLHVYRFNTYYAGALSVLYIYLFIISTPKRLDKKKRHQQEKTLSGQIRTGELVEEEEAEEEKAIKRKKKQGQRRGQQENISTQGKNIEKEDGK